MIVLLTIRETIRNLYERFQRVLRPLFQFLMSGVLFYSLNEMFHYSETLGKLPVIIGIAFICMWLPLGAIFLLSICYIGAQLFTSFPEIAMVSMILFLVIYLFYLRLDSKMCLPLLFIPVAMLCHIPYIVPLLVGVFLGPAGVIPTGFGLFFYYFSIHVKETVALIGSASATSGEVEAYHYLLEQLLGDKEMLLMMLVFSIVILIVWICYRMSRKDAWNQAIIIGGISGMVLSLAGGYVIDVDIAIVNIIVGFIIAVCLTIVVQFFKCIVDYTRVEYVQFEDDEYYYYVKAIPKVSMAQKEVNIKRINTRRHIKNNDKSVEEVE